MGEVRNIREHRKAKLNVNAKMVNLNHADKIAANVLANMAEALQLIGGAFLDTGRDLRADRLLTAGIAIADEARLIRKDIESRTR